MLTIRVPRICTLSPSRVSKVDLIACHLPVLETWSCAQSRRGSQNSEKKVHELISSDLQHSYREISILLVASKYQILCCCGRFHAAIFLMFLFCIIVMPAVIVRQRKHWRRPDGVFIYFEDNAGVIVNAKGEMKGSAITGPVAKECADLWPKIASAAGTVV